MDAVLMEWGGLLLRWVHIITGIAWIGSSFYFMHIDATIKSIPEIPAGKGGETWEVHGGGFYQHVGWVRRLRAVTQRSVHDDVGLRRRRAV